MLAQLLTLLATIDPFGTLALFVGLTAHLSAKARRRTALEAVSLTAAILLAFLIVGEPLLHFLGVSLSAFQLSGGIVFFLFGLQMIFGEATGERAAEQGSHSHEETEEDRRALAIYPLAIPSMASPGAILAVVMMTRNDQHPIGEQVVTATLLLGVLLFTLLLLLLSTRIFKLIGTGGANLMVRLLGLLLTSIAGQMVIDALIEITQGL